MEILFGIMAGIGLSSACGFRIFAPMLLMSVAAISGHLHLSPGSEWMGTYPALLVFLSATAAEIAAYYVPVVDNALDAIATPAAVIAGILVMSSFIQDMDPVLKWSLAVILGGSSSGLTQVFTSAVRVSSTSTTAGLGNPVISTLELIFSIVISIIALLMPLLVAVILVLIVILFMRKKKQLKSKARREL